MKKYLLALLFAAAVFQSAGLCAENVPLKLHPLFQDNYVFCAGKSFRISGTQNPGSAVTVKFPDKSYRGTAGNDGRFSVEIPPLPVIRKPFAVSVSCGDETIVVKNAVSGLVLLAGGQSNMEVTVAEALNPEQEAAAADYPLIREFKAEHDFDFVPSDTLKGSWKAVSPKTAPHVGAASYYCARMLHQVMDGIPVGIINNSYSASPQQAWIPLESVRKIAPNLARSYDKYKHLGHDGLIEYREKLGQSLVLSDSGNKGADKGWHKENFDDSAWKDIKVPDFLESVYGEKDGSFWFRRKITVSPEFAGKPLELELGVIDDYDVTYFNGVKVGETGEETPDTWTVKRYYTVPAGLVHEGVNVISIRCFDSGHAGGLFDKPMTVKCGGKIVEDITGLWKTQAEQILEPVSWPPDYLPLVKCYHFASVLYNAMFYPLRHTPVNAILWYQGESNAGSASLEPMFQECIRTWRKDLDDEKGEIPFLFVQLAAYQAPQSDPNNCGEWPVTRYYQSKARALPHTYMIPAIDIGDAKHIHPKNKQELGRRFALQLLQDEFKHPDYANAVSYPEIEKAVLSADGSKIILTLKKPEKLHLSSGNVPHPISVAGPQFKEKYVMKRTFYRASAAIENDTIIVTVPAEVSKPEIVRYGWMQNPEVNVFNEKGFPLLPAEIAIESK